MQVYCVEVKKNDVIDEIYFGYSEKNLAFREYHKRCRSMEFRKIKGTARLREDTIKDLKISHVVARCLNGSGWLESSRVIDEREFGDDNK